jgi:hypothetical protein
MVCMDLWLWTISSLVLVRCWFFRFRYSVYGYDTYGWYRVVHSWLEGFLLYKFTNVFRRSFGEDFPAGFICRYRRFNIYIYIYIWYGKPRLYAWAASGFYVADFSMATRYIGDISSGWLLTGLSERYRSVPASKDAGELGRLHNSSW